ncbi:MAG: Com family DNA-binding transcriptional regulator [Oscillospiraceae bacterium]|nr:Com family DNA-binding transcriptional regulator [Oscillospiraceae bacterium]
MLVLEQVRCPQCQKLLGALNGQAQIKCGRCKALIDIDTEKRTIKIIKERQK